MLRIRRVDLYKIKSFDGSVSIDFDAAKPVHALSGKNGSGKSTILKAIWLVQKIHFCDLLSDDHELQLARGEARDFLTTKESLIRIEFSCKEDGDQIWVPASIALEIRDGVPRLQYVNPAKLRSFWNLDDPSGIVLFIDASKEFSKETLSHEQINISQNSQKLFLSAILRPDALFHGVYKQLVTDYVHDRLVPSSSERLAYYKVAKKIFANLVPDVELSNFSGNHRPGEFVLLGKAHRANSMPLYDVRDFSSGEKTLLSTLVFLCMSKSVSVLMIDEPENHLHENLLFRFIEFLHQICSPGGFGKWIDEDLTEGKKKRHLYLESYSGYNLSQVFYSTHSKGIIYRTFLIGQNYLIDGSNVVRLSDDYESKLRKVGLSSINNKVVFVEGSGDSEALQAALGHLGVSIKPLDGSLAVIETFKRVSGIESLLRDSKFVFIVDSDNKPDSFFDQLRDVNQDFYDRTFIKLDRHELENYLLEPRLIHQLIMSYSEIHSLSMKVSEDGVRKKISEFGMESLPQVYKKELSLAFQHIISSEFSRRIWGNKGFDWSGKDKIFRQIDENVLCGEGLDSIRGQFNDAVSRVFDGYGNASYEVIAARCDGKQVLGKVCKHFSSVARVDAKGFRQALYSRAFAGTSTLAGALVAKISQKLGDN